MSAKKHILFLLGIIGPLLSLGQLVVDFTTQSGFRKGADTVVVCAPASVKFISKSSYNGSPILESDADYRYAWEFEQLTGEINLVSPEISYSNPGVYAVSLRITKLSTGESKTLLRSGYIEVLTRPVVDFTLQDFEGCVPLSVKCSNKSVLNEANGATYNWVLTGVTSSNEENPTLTVPNFGTYNLSLEVTDRYGCKATKTKNEAVLAKKQPKATWTASDTLFCSVPKDITLTADEPTNHRFRWVTDNPIDTLFGRSVTLSPAEEKPVGITLLVDSGLNCSSSFTDTLAIDYEPITAYFFLADTVCPRDFLLRAYGFGFDSTSWSSEDIPDLKVIGEEANFTLDDPGDYTVCMTAYNKSRNCSITDCKTVTILDYNFTLTPSDTVACSLPAVFDFEISNSNLPSNADITWTRNGSYQGADYNKTQTSYTFYSFGKHTVRATMYDPESNCRIEKEIELKIEKPNPSFKQTKSMGCAPLEVTFTNTTAFKPDSVVEGVWKFFKDSDVIPVFTASSLDSLTYTFTEHGDYTTRFVVKNLSGCLDSISFKLEVGTKPTVDFHALPPDTCAGHSTKLQDSSFVMVDGVKRYDLIDSHFWLFPEKKGHNGPSMQILNTLFGHDTLNGVPQGSPVGTHVGLDVYLQVGYNGCFDTLRKREYLDRYAPALGPVQYIQPCGSDTLYVYAGMSGWTTREWIVDDKTASNNDQYILETFPSYQNTTFNGLAVGPLIHSQQAYTYDTLKIFAPNGFKGTVSVYLKNDAYPSLDSCETGRQAIIDNLSPVVINEAPRHCFLEDSEPKELRLSALNSSGFTAWYIKPPGGTSQPKAFNTTVYTLKPNLPGVYEVIFEYDREKPCPKKYIKEIEFIMPQVEVEIESGDVVGCQSTTLDVIGKELENSVGIRTWTWNFIDRSDSANHVVLATHDGIDPPAFTFNGNGEYIINLIAIDSLGCATFSSFGQEVYLADPIADFELLKTGYCQGDSLLLENLSDFPGALGYEWYLEGNLISNDSIPIYLSPDLDSLSLQLMVEGNNCRDTSAVKKFVVDHPLDIDFTGSPTYVNCPPLTAQFESQLLSPTKSEISYTWLLAIDTAYGDKTVGFYDRPGFYDVILMGESKHGCRDTVVKQNFIEVGGPTADEIYSVSKHLCPKDSFDLAVLGVKNTDKLKWTLGDGKVLNALYPDTAIRYAYDRSYADSIEVVVFLEKDGCEVAIGQKLKVQEIIPQIDLSDDTLCGIPQTIQFELANTEKNLKARWGSDLQSLSDNNELTFNQLGDNYVFVEVVDTLTFCSTIDSIAFYINPGPQISAPSDTVLCAGDGALVTFRGADSYTWAPLQGLEKRSTVDSVLELWVNPSISTRYTIEGFDQETGCTVAHEFYVGRDSTAGFVDMSLSNICDTGTICMQYLPLGAHVGSNWEWQFSGGYHDDFISGQISKYRVTRADGLTVNLLFWDKGRHCAIEQEENFFTYPLPDLNLADTAVFCAGTPIQLSSNSALNNHLWSPALEISKTTISNPTVEPNSSRYYRVSASDERACEATDSIYVLRINDYVIDPMPLGDTIDVGDTVHFDFEVYDAETGGLYPSYFLWTPELYLPCTACKNISFRPLKSTLYTLKHSDPYSCFPRDYEVFIKVNETYLISMPTAFTPNDDNLNELVRVRGKGIEKLLSFSVFNRWGEQVFYTEDLTEGWDGYYKDQLQNPDHYAYEIKVLYFNGEIATQSGMLQLLR